MSLRRIGRASAARWLPLAGVLWALAASGACVSSANAGVKSSGHAPAKKGRVQRGKATWYGGKFHGRKTASGERFDKRSMTAAHRTLPFGTIVRVTNLRNKRSVEVRINNRGPYGKGRIIDVSEAAARKLGMISAGVVPVTVEVVRLPKKKKKKRKHRRHRS